MIKRIKRIFIADRDEFVLKCRKLYGRGDFEAKYQAYCKSRKKLITSACILGAVLLAAVLYSGHMNEYHLEQKEQYIALAKDQKEMDIPVTVEASRDGRTVRRSVVLHITEDEENEKEDEAGSEDKPQEAIISDNIELERSIDEAVKKAENSPSRKEVLLPVHSGDDVAISWEIEQNRSSMPFLMILVLAGFCLYKSRLSKIEKDIEHARKNIESELPGFISNFALLLNSGLVQSEAFRRIIAGRDGGSPGFFYSRLRDVLDDCIRTNMSFENGLCIFAKDSGVREFVRVSNIIQDNVSRGTGLAAKMEKESSELWFLRKKRAEEKGRLAETQLTMPLVVLLLVLIVITIAPAMLDF